MNDSFKDMITKGWLELDLHMKLKKCKFGVKEVDFLGLIL